MRDYYDEYEDGNDNTNDNLEIARTLRDMLPQLDIDIKYVYDYISRNNVQQYKITEYDLINHAENIAKEITGGSFYNVVRTAPSIKKHYYF